MTTEVGAVRSGCGQGGSEGRDRGQVARACLTPTTEVPKQESRLVAPSDFFATPEEREAVREWEAARGGELTGAGDRR